MHCAETVHSFDSTADICLPVFPEPQPEVEVLNQQQAYELALQEKSEEIRRLQQRVHELEAIVLRSGVAPEWANPTGQATGLLRLKRELALRDRLLKQAEEHMVERMRELEVTIATERVEIARQRQAVERMREEVERDRASLQREYDLCHSFDIWELPLNDAKPVQL